MQNRIVARCHSLYCFDEKLCKQGSVSIYSLLENVDQKITIHVITDLKSKTQLNFLKKLRKRPNLERLPYYRIEMPQLDLYNMEKELKRHGSYFL